MSCKVKQKSIDFLEAKGAINNEGVILDQNVFKELNKLLTSIAYTQYSVGDNVMKLFSTTSEVKISDVGQPTTIEKVKMNDKLFTILTDAVNSFEEVVTDELKEKYNKKLIDLPTSNDAESMLLSPTTFEETLQDEEFSASPNEFILFGDTDISALDNKRVIPATEVLNNIINNYPNLTEDASDILKQASYLLPLTDATVHVVPSAVMGGNNFLMQYHSNKGVSDIHIPLSRLQDREMEDVVLTFLHEVWHSVSLRAIENPITEEQKMFSSFMKKAYNKYKNSPNDPNLYGFKDENEFVAEIMTNKKFQEEIKSQDKRWWNQLINFLRRLFKMKKTVSYNNIVEAILDISNTKQEGREAIFAAKEVDEDKKIVLRTLEDRLEHTIKRIHLSVEKSIKGVEIQLSRVKDEEIKDGLERQIGTFKELQGNINSYRDVNLIYAIGEFADVMANNMSHLQRSLDKVDLTDVNFMKNAVDRYNKVLSAYSIIDEVKTLLSDVSRDVHQTVVGPKDLITISDKITNADNKFGKITLNLFSVMKNVMKVELHDIKYFPNIISDHEERLHQEANTRKIPKNQRKAWIYKTLNGRDAEKVEKSLENEVQKLLLNPAFDIYAADTWFSSGINVSSKLVQIMNFMLLEIDNKRNELRREKDKQFESMFKALVKEKGTNDIKKLYKNIIEFDSNGKAFLRGKYNVNFYQDVFLKIKEIKAQVIEDILEYQIIMDNFEPETVEFEAARGELEKIHLAANKKIEKLEKNYIKNSNGDNIPSTKFLNNLTSLTPTEKKVLDFFIELADDIQNMTHQRFDSSNIKYAVNAKFYALPRVTKLDSERIWQGDGLGIVKDKFTDLTKRKADDVGNRTVHTDLAGNEIFDLKLWYRASDKSFNPKDQSLDLMTIMRMDYINATTYAVRKESEQKLNFLMDFAKQHKFYDSRKRIDSSSGKYRTVDGQVSETYKMLKNMLEYRLYDMYNLDRGEVNKFDVNTAVRYLNSTSAFLTLSFNYASGTANVLNANAQLFLESFISGEFIKAKGLAKANKIYGSTLLGTVRDIVNPINRGYVNQINEYFNTRGLFNISEANFLKNSMIKAGFTLRSAQIFQESGEHYIQSVTAMAVLDGIKVMDADHNFINEKGEIVDEDKAASLLDMMVVDKIDGVVKLNPKVIYTTHSKLTTWDKGGKAHIDSLIRKKIYDVVGNYTKTDQAKVFRANLGKLTMLYRKYLIPMGVSRFRGIENALVNKADMTDDMKRYSYALQQYEEGSYTTVVRFMSSSIKNMKLYLTGKERNWEKLTTYEKHNIKKAVTELIMTKVILPLVGAFVYALGGGDDEMANFIAYEIRRLETELSAYRDVTEFFKMIKSPIPSMRLLELGSSAIKSVFPPTTVQETYKIGKYKGQNKLKIKIFKQLPVVKESYRTFGDLWKYQNSTWGH